jgi:hypothetical protein
MDNKINNISNNIEELAESMINLSKSTKDSNKFYSVLLDARATAISENTYDIAERLLKGEKENAKAALEHLWSLKKTMFNQSEVSTIDLIIKYYQKKLDILRNKEENIKRLSKDSRNLLEDKRKKDAEIATIKQEIADCTKELNELTEKLEKLKIKEQELILIDTQLKKELQLNENEIINGLYEIIISQGELDSSINEYTDNIISQEKQTEKISLKNDPQDTSAIPKENKSSNVDTTEIPINEEIFEIDKEKTSAISLDVLSQSQQQDKTSDQLLKVYKEPDISPYPKSVVKTTKGKVIGEYYYDPKVYKNKRHYIFNSKFFYEQLFTGLKILTTRADNIIYSELLQMIQDALKRTSENKNMHFEICTNEFLNEKALKELWQNIKSRNFTDAFNYCKRLGAKLEALKPNYHAMLKEQMGRYSVE